MHLIPYPSYFGLHDVGGFVSVQWLLDRASILFPGLDLDPATIVAGVTIGAAVSVECGPVGGMAAGLFVAVHFRPSRRHAWVWPQTPGARLLALLMRPFLRSLTPVKVEELGADLAELDSRWERAIYLVDFICHLPELGWAARGGGGTAP